MTPSPAPSAATFPLASMALDTLEGEQSCREFLHGVRAQHATGAELQTRLSRLTAAGQQGFLNVLRKALGAAA